MWMNYCPPSASWPRIGILFVGALGLVLDSAVADNFARNVEARVLRVGQERKEDKLPLRGGGGKCLYELLDMKESVSYEVKISYPATIPSSFSLSLLKEADEDNQSGHSRRRRKLLNTEKIIFENTATEQNIRALVLVTVAPAGVVAGESNVKEQEFVIYNIMLEEVRFGAIPLQAFWVGFLGLLAIVGSLLAGQHCSAFVEGETANLSVVKQAIS